jgi:hypothetical protein
LPVVATGCVQRECTEEEREAAGADANDECTKFVALKEYTADDSDTKSQSWSDGDDVRLTGRIRHVRVEEGDSDDEVVVEYTAQVDLASGREQDVVDRTLGHLETSMRRSGDTVMFSADRGSSEARLGAKITVKLPQGFNGQLWIDKTNTLRGDVDIRYLGDAPELVVDMNATGGDLTFRDVSSLRHVEINTHGDIIGESAFSDELRTALLHNTIGEIDVSFDAPPSSHALIVAEFGDVAVRVPEDGAFNLSANGQDGVSLAGSSDCITATENEELELMQCNGGDPDGLTFDIVADGEVSVGFL